MHWLLFLSTVSWSSSVPLHLLSHPSGMSPPFLSFRWTLTHFLNIALPVNNGSSPVVLLSSPLQQNLSVFPSTLSQFSYIYILVLFLRHLKLTVDMSVILDNRFCDYKLINLAFTIRMFYSSMIWRYTWSSFYISFQQNFEMHNRGCLPFGCQSLTSESTSCSQFISLP